MIAIEGYDQLALIGQGGLGDVYRARRVSTGSTVAIKVLRDVSDESVAWHRTRRELTALVALGGHGNVIQLLELLDLPEGPALVMEYAPGGSVADLVQARGHLELGEVVLIGRHTTAALVAAHRQGIVHRDIKPQNLLIDAHGQVKLCDFGVAALTHSEEFRTRTSALSMRYASPEDLDDELDVGPPSDVYSLGATLLHLAHGAPPTLKERLAPWVAPPTDDHDQAMLDEVVAACLHPDPDRRPDAPEVLDRLEAIDWTLGDRHRALVVDVAGGPLPADSPVAPSPADRSGPAGPIGRSAEPAPGPTPAPAPRAAGSSAAPAEEDTTQRRPDRQPLRSSPAEEPAPRRRHRRWFGVAAALVAIAVVAVVLVAWPFGDDPTDDEIATPSTAGSTAPVTEAPTTTTEPAAEFAVVARPDELTPIDDPAIVWPFGEPGECLVQRRARDELVAIGCDQPHDLQRYVVASLDRFDADAPFDADAVRDAVTEACTAAFEPFIGVAAVESELDAPFTMPSAATWAEGDRRYQCLVGVPGKRVVGDATGIRR